MLKKGVITQQKSNLCHLPSFQECGLLLGPLRGTQIMVLFRNHVWSACLNGPILSILPYEVKQCLANISMAAAWCPIRPSIHLMAFGSSGWRHGCWCQGGRDGSLDMMASCLNIDLPPFSQGHGWANAEKTL